ncbi:phospholipase A [Melaminivora sp.]|uniref:phospholipase A n=1 Tax=Melaminivora sp. TaxID=1933032 RepID=UPI0028AC5D72|nr:phospholipase A [Melaminivora sp.]
MPRPPSALHPRSRAGRARPLSALLLAALLPLPALARQAAPAPATEAGPGWRQCAALGGDDSARLACFDQWAGQQVWRAPAASASALPAEGGARPEGGPAGSAAVQAAPAHVRAEPTEDGCRDDTYSTLSRFWELDEDTDCGLLRFRGYRPMTVSVVASSSVNRQPTSDNQDNTAQRPVDYRRSEMRMQLSVRTKLASGLLPVADPRLRDSLWFGYTQQSYWQLFSSQISRPFRNTDHEPEIMYVYPTDAALPWGWRWRYSGIGLVHQSNGQSDPLSRSWNRAYLMTGFEQGDRFSVTARVWKRLRESADRDDNPGISNYIGRAELSLGWNPDRDNRLTLTTRHALAGSGRGSVRLDWLHTLGTHLVGPRSNLRLHTQLFSGYGDSLIDYNRRRTVFSVGVSLVDF